MAAILDIMNYLQLSKDNRRITIAGTYPKNIASGDTFRVNLSTLDVAEAFVVATGLPVPLTWTAASQTLTVGDTAASSTPWSTGLRFNIRGAA